MLPSVGSCVFLSMCGACLCGAGLVLRFSAWLRLVPGVGFVQPSPCTVRAFTVQAHVLLSVFYRLSL
jgi:hypothetical protein